MTPARLVGNTYYYNDDQSADAAVRLSPFPSIAARLVKLRTEAVVAEGEMRDLGYPRPVTQRSKDVMRAYAVGINDDTPDGRACRAVAAWLAKREQRA